MVPATHAASRLTMNSKPSLDMRVMNGDGVGSIARGVLRLTSSRFITDSVRTMRAELRRDHACT